MGGAVYRILVRERLDQRWEDRFAPMHLTAEDHVTMLRGPVSDQAMLHGILERIRNLNLTILLVERIEDQKGEDTA